MKEKLNYKEHKSLFESIKPEQRSAWIRKMLQTEQKKGEYPVYKKQYPNHGKWNHKGNELHYYYSLHKEQPAKAILFYFPGMNAHAGGSAYFTMGIAQKCNIDIYGLDYKNFGRSTGNSRGYIQSVDQFIQQAQDFVQYILSQQKQKVKVYISGLSMGGGVCFKLALRHPQRYAGVIFLSPALRQNKQAQPIGKKIAKFIGYIFPTMKTLDQKFNTATKYDQTQRVMQDQYMYTDKVIPGSVRTLLNFMQQVEQEWNKFTSPFIIIQSGVDKLVDPFLALDFEKQCKSADKTVIYFKDMWHAIFGEDQLPEVIQAVIQWLQPRLSK